MWNQECLSGLNSSRPTTFTTMPFATGRRVTNCSTLLSTSSYSNQLTKYPAPIRSVDSITRMFFFWKIFPILYIQVQFCKFLQDQLIVSRSPYKFIFALNCLQNITRFLHKILTSDLPICDIYLEKPQTIHIATTHPTL